MTTVTGVDMNPDGIPDGLQQPQFGLAPDGFATPVQHGAPLMTVTDVDMNVTTIQTSYNNRSLVTWAR